MSERTLEVRQQSATPVIKSLQSAILQRTAIKPSPVHDVPPIAHEVPRSPGQPLDTATRAFMEPRFGHGSSYAHTDAKPAERALSVYGEIDNTR